MNPFRKRALLRTLEAAVLATLASTGTARAQVSPPAPSRPAAAAPPYQASAQNPAPPCEQPPPLVSWSDYNGPLKKVVGTFARKLERKSVHPPHYKPGVKLCSLDPKDKIKLVVQDTLDPVTFLTAGYNAGLSQAQNDDPQFHQGAAGYVRRFGAAYADQASSKFFAGFVFPTIFSEDPRYYRMAHGSGKKRLGHAVTHLFIGYRDNGTRELNYSLWLGTVSAFSLSNVYHPGNKRGFSPTAEAVGFSFANDVGWDVLREFWPEISRKFKLPFRDQHEPKPQATP